MFAPNIENWYLIDICCMAHGLQLAPLYDTLGEDTVKYVLNQTKTTTLALTDSHIELICDLKQKGQLEYLLNLIYMDDISQEHARLAKDSGFITYKMESLIKFGANNPVDYTKRKINDDTIWTLCYTSGTTGDPKGVMITQKNFCSMMAAISMGSFNYIPRKETVLSYLPLAHVAERCIYFSTFYYGGKIACFYGDKKKLTAVCGIVKPTIFLSVPRLYNKIFNVFKAKIADLKGCKACLVTNGVKTKAKNIDTKSDYTHCFYDKIFKKFRNALGGRVRLMITGAAPISDEVKKFFKIVIGAPLIEAYGQTECSGVSNFVHQDDPTDGHVGGPCCNNEIMLQDVPSMNYTHTDKEGIRGEVCIRGTNVMAGYYKMPQKTVDTVDEEGWLHTGDIGVILKSGALKIIDRKKNLFKLAQGEYVSPEKVENIYVKFPYIDESFLHGDSFKQFCVGIIGVNKEGLTKFANENGFN